MQGAGMQLRAAFVWRISILIFALLILWMLSLAVYTPHSEPITIGATAPPPPAGISVVVEITPSDQESPLVKSYFEECCKIGSYQKIKGWVYVENQETMGQEVCVQLKKKDGSAVHYSTMLIERRDVGIHFKNPQYNSSGFSALIPLKNSLDIDSCTIRLVVKNKNGIYTGKIWQARRGG